MTSRPTALALAVAAGACASLDGTIAVQLDAMSAGTTRGREAHFSRLLEGALAKDAYRCEPLPSVVLAPPPSDLPERRIAGTMPHYSWVDGPMRYRVGTAVTPTGERVWSVRVNIAVDPPLGGTLELPDCELRGLDGPVTCRGTPYAEAPGVEACPASGEFRAPVTRRNVTALLARWSREAEGFYNRDARRFGLPVRYDFELFAQDDPAAIRQPIDVRLPLRPSCARTPYFQALRSGWSLPVVAHEIGHFLGLLDEYEAFSGIVPCYPKTPFAGSEKSRMGLSMKPDTLLYPLHHYLVLRRYHCPEPAVRDRYRAPLPP